MVMGGRCGGGGGRGGIFVLLVCFSLLTVDDASLSRQSGGLKAGVVMCVFVCLFVFCLKWCCILPRPPLPPCIYVESYACPPFGAAVWVVFCFNFSVVIVS